MKKSFTAFSDWWALIPKRWIRHWAFWAISLCCVLVLAAALVRSNTPNTPPLALSNQNDDVPPQEANQPVQPALATTTKPLATTLLPSNKALQDKTPKPVKPQDAMQQSAKGMQNTLAGSKKPALLKNGGGTTAPTATPKSSHTIEDRLANVYHLAVVGKFPDALAAAQKLVQEYPTFQPAQLVLGDLLLAQAGTTSQFGSMVEATAPLAHRWRNRLQGLQLESKKRLQALSDPAPIGKIPRAFALLAPTVRHAIAVDAARSRLYLFAQDEAGFHLVNDFYISIGEAGLGKEKEGDNRTPSGLYYINGYIDKENLDNFYGAGALPIDYPNAFDLSLGRTGSGIWFHGSPPDQFSRIPQASAGCIVLADPDMDMLLKTVDLKNTPVVIDEHLQWISNAQLAQERAPLIQVLTQWAQAVSNGDPDKIEQFYINGSSAKDKGFTLVWPENAQRHNPLRGKNLALKNVSLLRWQQEKPYAILSFDIVTDANHHVHGSLRQYWVPNNGNGWRILFEREL